MRRPSARVLAIDRDAAAIAAGSELAAAHPGRLTLCEGRFGDLDQIAEANGFAPADGVVLDIGISSMQIDDPARGFSFQKDGPLDMRMSASGPTAADVVNTAEEAHLADILYHLGEERSARGIARAIVRRRAEAPFETHLRSRCTGRPRARPREDRRPPRGDAHLPGAAHLRQRRAGRAGPRAGRRRARPRAGRTPGGRHLPFPGRRPAQALPARAGHARSRRARVIFRRVRLRAGRPASASTVRARSVRPRPKSTQTPVRARQNCAWRSAPRRQPGPTTAPNWRFPAFSLPRARPRLTPQARHNKKPSMRHPTRRTRPSKARFEGQCSSRC